MLLGPASWACAILAALRFEEVLLPPSVRRSLLPRRGSSDGAGRGWRRLLPPWQQGLVDGEGWRVGRSSEVADDALDDEGAVADEGPPQAAGEGERSMDAEVEDGPSGGEGDVNEAASSAEVEDRHETVGQNSELMDAEVVNTAAADGPPGAGEVAASDEKEEILDGCTEEGGADGLDDADGGESNESDDKGAENGANDAAGATPEQHRVDARSVDGETDLVAEDGVADESSAKGIVDEDDGLDEEIPLDQSPEEPGPEPVPRDVADENDGGDDYEDNVNAPSTVDTAGGSDLEGVHIPGDDAPIDNEPIVSDGPPHEDTIDSGEEPEMATEPMISPDEVGDDGAVDDTATTSFDDESKEGQSLPPNRTAGAAINKSYRHQETATFVDKLCSTANIGAFASSALSIVYCIAVHSFLSFFHERSFFVGKHWRPILLRIAVAVLVWGLRWGAQVRWMACDGGSDSMALEILFALVTAVVSVKLILATRREEADGPPPPPVPMEGRVVLITGANAGIGLETARQLYDMGATIVLGCRSKTRAEAAKKDIVRSTSEEGSAENRVHILEIDLSSLSSVRKAARSFLEMGLPLHVLVNNAGVMRKDRDETEDGLEMTMAANHLGHFLLTNLLLPKLRETASRERRSTRVVNVSSSLYRTAQRFNAAINEIESGIDLDDLLCQKRKYSLFGQYVQSKLANVLFAIELGRREKLTVAAGSTITTPRKKSKKKIRPKLTPVEDPVDDGVLREDSGLGFNDIVLSPGKTTPPRNEKKKMRPKLTPVEDPMDDDEEFHDEDGLGFGHIVAVASPSPAREKKKTRIRPTAASTDSIDEKKDEDDSKDEVMLPQRKEKNGARRKLTPISPTEVTDDEDDEAGLGFGEIASPGQGSSPEMPLENEQGNRTPRTDQFFPVLSLCLHPGLVRTDVTRNMPWFLRYPNMACSIILAALQKTPRSGGYTSVYCAVADVKDATGCYYVNSGLQPLDRLALDADDARKLWELSDKLVSVN